MRRAEFDTDALEDLLWWIETDRRTAVRVMRLVREVCSSPFDGTGKPEPLRFHLKGAWSRRITQEHRLVYRVETDRVRILACRYHYGR